MMCVFRPKRRSSARLFVLNSADLAIDKGHENTFVATVGELVYLFGEEQAKWIWRHGGDDIELE
jgi:hypothetical protein